MILDSLIYVNVNMLNNNENFDIDFDIHFTIYFLRVINDVIEFSIFEENGENNIRIYRDNVEITRRQFIFYFQYVYILDLIREINNNTDELSRVVSIINSNINGININNHINNINNNNINELQELRKEYFNNVHLLTDYLKRLKKVGKTSDYEKLYQDIILVKENM